MEKKFRSFVDNASQEVKLEAVLERALADKITIETVEQKVEAQINSIDFGIKKINSRFTAKSKNYSIVKEQVSELMERYEMALKQLGEFYDEKIEQLILRKFELQINFIGSVVRQEYLIRQRNIKNNVKNNDRIKNILTLGIKKTIEIIKEKKRKSNIDVKEINKLKDKEAIEKEHMSKINNGIEVIEDKIIKNKIYMEKINKEIYLITLEIKKLNERKKEALLNAFESDEKGMITKIKKPRTFERITRFFSSKINTPKVIKQTLIDPLSEKINYFVENELSNVK